MRQIILDIETTGLDVNKGDRIIEFAAIEVIDRKLSGRQLHLYINPERDVSDESYKIHGISNQDLINKPIFKDVALEIIAFIRDSELIIHNAKFDIGFIDYQLTQCNLGITKNYSVNIIDTLIIARNKFPNVKNSLDALCDRFSVDRTNRSLHGALIDCYLLYEVFINLTREQTSLFLNESKTLNIEGDMQIAYSDNLTIQYASSNELDLHAKIMKKIKNGDSCSNS